MAKQEARQIDFYGGISHAKKIGQEGSFRFGTHLDTTSDPNEIKLNLAGRKVSSTEVTGLVKWIVDGTPHDTNRYAVDDAGAIYKIDFSDTFTKLKTVSNCSGQGLEVHSDYLYYTQDTQIGRYGPLSGTPTFTDNWQTGLNDTSASGFAPIIAFKEGFAVGHGSNVAWWDGAVWDANALTLPAELNVRSFTLSDQYIVIGAWRGNAVTDSEDGYIFLWDSLSDTFNDFNPTEGGLNAMFYYRNLMLSIQGNQGYIYTDAKPFNKIHQIKDVDVQEFVETYPGAITSWKGLVYFAVSNSDSTTVKRGVYSYGSKDAIFPESLNYAFSISTGNNGSTVQIGAVKGIGSDLYIAWKDDSTYGVDKIDETSDYVSSGAYESLIVDDQRPSKPKKGREIKVTHLPLAEGESITIKHKKERDSTWRTGTANAVDDTTETVFNLEGALGNNTDYNPDGSRFRELEAQVTLAGDGSSTPTVTEINIEYDDLKKEGQD